MNISEYPFDGRIGKIIELDEPGDLDTMYRMVHQTLRRDIKEMRDALFVLVVFRQTPKKKSEQCLDEGGWYPLQDRKGLHLSNIWHSHQAVVVHCPYQEEIVVPTGVSTTKLVADAREKTGITTPKEIEGGRKAQLKFKDALPHFASNALQPSGHSLIIPAGEVHAKLVAEEDMKGTGGVVQRRAWL